MAVDMVASRVVALAALRIVGILASAWVGVALLAVQALIWVLSDDELQKWCRACPFARPGEAQNSFAATNIEGQQEQFQKALIAVQ